MPSLHDSKDLQWLIDMLLPMINGAQQRRKSVENEWLLNYRAWQGWPSQTYTLPLPDNAIHYFIPHLRRIIERNVARVTKLEMPNIDWHQTLPSNSTISPENAEAVHTTLRYILQKKIPVKRNISMLARCLYLYDFAILHTSVIIQNKDVWPYQKVVDPYSFYIYPDTALSLEDALLLFEESIVPYQVYKSFVSESKSTSLYLDIDAKDLHVPTWPYHIVERIAYRGLTRPSDSFTANGNTKQYLTEAEINKNRDKAKSTLIEQARAFVKLYKCYFRLGSEWFYTVIAENLEQPRIVRLDEEENTPTYRWTNSRPLPGELYTNSQADDNRVLQNLSNTSLSQIESNRTRTAEPPIAVDASQVGRLQSKTFANREWWHFQGNPNDIIKEMSIQDTSAEGIKAMQIYLQLMDKNAGGTLAEGNPGRNMPRSGSAAINLMSLAMVEIEDIADTLEQDILSPSLGDIYHTILEYVPNKQLFKIPNKRPDLVKVFSKRDLYGDYSFTWLGSLGVQDSEANAQRAISFLSMLLNPQILQLLTQQLEQQGKMLDIATILEKVYSYSLAEKGLGDIIIPIPPQVAQARQQALAQQQQNNPQLIQAQLKQQELQGNQQSDQVKLQLEMIKAQGTQQKTQAEIQKAALEAQGKVIELKSKQQDLANSHLQHRREHLQFLKSMNDSSTSSNEETGD
jgi:hypothetical protein